MKRTTEGEERFAYGSVLEALSRGLYPDKRHVLREFVQNAYDGLYELRKQYPREPLRPIEVKVEPPSILIGDWGVGMPQEKMREYRYLGYSEKERGEHAGFRGIGKYSGLAVAEKIIVDSSPYGVPERIQVVIHVGEMIEAVDRGKNPPLETLLSEFTELNVTSDNPTEHYTFVELHKIRKDAAGLFDADALKSYLSQTAPVPLNPEFKYSADIQRRLVDTIPHFLAVGMNLNTEPIYKPFFPECREPEYETILFSDERPDILAFSWYCENAVKGQFEPRDTAGLVYRAKNIGVGDGQLSRRTLWRRTPERAFYFFGEIHVLDPDVIPSSDRTDFEDNAGRIRLYERCQRIVSILNRKAGEESALRRFDDVLTKGNETLTTRETGVTSGELPVELKDEVVYEISKLQEDVKKRLSKSKDPRLKRRAKNLLGRSRRLLAGIREEPATFYDLQGALKFNARLRFLYNTIISVLKDELRHEPSRLERVIRAIHQAIRVKTAS